jgi:hypothetical protein
MKPRGNRARLKLHCNYAASEIIRCQVCRTTQELAERLPRVSFLSAAAARLLSSSRIDSEFCLIHAAAACFTPWALFYIYTFMLLLLILLMMRLPLFTLLIQWFVHIGVVLICCWVEQSPT